MNFPNLNRLKISLLLFIIISLLSACNSGKNEPAPVTESVSNTAINPQKAAPSIHDQISTLIKQKDIWLKEDSRILGSGEDSYIEGPFYSLMDLDQDGYLEIVVTDETGQSCPSFYEVTEEGTLKKWAMEGDLPQSVSEISIFDTTSKADCYYDAAHKQYHYIINDKLALCQDSADVIYLDMMPNGSGITFKKIGRYTFDASTDNEYHFFNAKGEECEERDITNVYSNMTKKTMFFSDTPIAIKEKDDVIKSSMEHTMWQKFTLRDDFRSEKEKELTDELRHQFVSLSISMDEYVTDLGDDRQTDKIRYTSTDLDNNNKIELIIENVTKQTWGIYEESGLGPKKWQTEGKKLTDYTKDNPSILWQTCTVSELKEMSYDLIEYNLRQAWLRFNIK